MRFLPLVRLGLFLALVTVARAALADPSATRTLPTSITIVTSPVKTQTATYSFSVVLSGCTVVDGVPQLTVTTTITKVAETEQVQFAAIIVQVAQDAASFRLKADGEEFVVEAGYRDPSERGIDPRPITTTFGQMFGGGKVGLSVRLAN